MEKELCPVIAGVAQFKQPKETFNPLDPLRLMVKACKMALGDSKTPSLKHYIDSIFMVNINSWSYKDAPEQLSIALGIKPVKKVYLPDGGDTPQLLVNRAVKKIMTRKSQVILITGAEAGYSLYRSQKGKVSLNWPIRRKPKYMEGNLWHGTSDFENKYNLIIPAYSYAIFETSLRSFLNHSLEEHNSYIAKIFEKFSKIASKNPYAWEKKSYSAEELITPAPNNREITHPYTKRLCSNVYVDQAAAIIIASKKIVEKLKIDQKKWVYPMGGVDFKNIFNITQRPKLYNSPAARIGIKYVLKRARLKLEEINLFDIYSCFPSIVEIIKNEIGLEEDDPRQLTITGGLPYFGGPWSTYSLHAIVTAVELIRKNPSLKIMIIANGGYNTKQSFGVYGSIPSANSIDTLKESREQDIILDQKLPKPVVKANGNLKIEGYTIPFDRYGYPSRGIAIGILEDGRRTIGFIHIKPKLMKKLITEELVGRTFPIFYNSRVKLNLIRLNNLV
jgi:acetyl-CoA C-acetyltransferase